MKKLILLFFSLALSSLFAQTVIQVEDHAVVLRTPGKYKIIAQDWSRSDSSVVYLAAAGTFDLSGSIIRAGASNALIEVANRKTFGSEDFPTLVMRDAHLEGLESHRQALRSMPMAIEAGTRQTGGLNHLTLERNVFLNTSGIKWKKARDQATGLIHANYFFNVNGAYYDANGTLLTNAEVSQRTGIAGSQLARHALAVGRSFDGSVKDIRITYNLIDNFTSKGMIEDVINISFNVDKSTVEIGADGVIKSSGGWIANNCVRGNYDAYWWRAGERQDGCPFIYDYQASGKIGGAAFVSNYAINGSNTSYTHATYGVGYYDSNVAVSSGYRNDSLITWVSRGFGLYHGNPDRELDMPVFTRNQSGVMNTRRAPNLFRHDFSTWRSGSTAWPDNIYNWNGPLSNIYIKKAQTITEEDEQFFFDQFIEHAQSKGITYQITGVDTEPDPPSVDCAQQIAALKAENTRLSSENAQLEAELAKYQSTVQEVLRLLQSL